MEWPGGATSASNWSRMVKIHSVDSVGFFFQKVNKRLYTAPSDAGVVN